MGSVVCDTVLRTHMALQNAYRPSIFMWANMLSTRMVHRDANRIPYSWYTQVQTDLIAKLRQMCSVLLWYTQIQLELVQTRPSFWLTDASDNDATQLQPPSALTWSGETHRCNTHVATQLQLASALTWSGETLRCSIHVATWLLSCN